jgi:tripartite-type tricarboxylate transporter receptor subunit TctC
MKGRMRLSTILIVVSCMVLGAFPCMAIEFPTKPITIVVPYPAGGGFDINSRIIAKHISPILKQAVVVENRPGGSGVIGYTYAAKSKPDGYTLAMIGTPVIYQILTIPNVSYTMKSFASIANINYEPNCMIVKTGGRLDMPVEKLIPYLKQHPNEFIAGTGGRWSSQHVAVEYLEMATGIKFRKVHFSGTKDTTVALLGGHIDIMMNYYSDPAAYIAAGQFKPLAVASEKRDPMVPNVPALKELGIDVSIGTWRAFAAPANTPVEVLDKIADAIKTALKRPEVIGEFRKINLDAEFTDRKGVDKIVENDLKSLTELVAKIKANGE